MTIRVFNPKENVYNYSVNNLNTQEYNNLVLYLCNKYNIVNQNNVTMSFYCDKMYGYISCSN